MSAKNNAKWVRLGDYIELCDERNSDGEYTVDDVRGISIQKNLIFTKADMQGVSLSPYKLLKPREFSYVTVTSRNGGKISLAINDTANTYIVSSSYVNFRSKNINILLPEYLFLLLSRSEFDRYARFNSWGSARETFDWSELCRVEIPLPDINVQKELVATYNGLKALAEQNEALIEPLSKAFEAFIVDCKAKYPMVELSNGQDDYIEICDERNSEAKYTLDNVRGISTDKEFIFMACVYTEHFFVCNHSRSDIKSRTGFGRYPVFFELEEFEQSRLYHFCVEVRHTHTRSRIIHTYKVVVDSEYGNFAFFGLVSLCALENTLCIVKHVGSGIHFERSVRHDFRLFPRAVFVVHYEHMVGKIFTETEF